MTSIHALQQQIADTLNADSVLVEGGVQALAENRLDIEGQIEAALAGVGIVATVVTPDVVRIGDLAEGPVGEVEELVVSIAEAAAVNRERPGAITALDAAVRVASLLHTASTSLKTIRQNYEEQRGLVVCNVAFATTLPISLTTPQED